MVLNAILQAFAGLLDLLLTPVHIPPLPEGLSSAISSGMGYVLDGLTIIAAFTHWSFLCGLFWAALAIEAVVLAYKFIRWIIQKIPVSME